VALSLIALLVLTLAFRPEPFVVLVVVAIGGGLWELRGAFETVDIKLPIWPLLVGGVGMAVSTFAGGAQALMIAFVLTVAVTCVWRIAEMLPGERGRAAGRDIAASVFASTWLPFLACFLILVLAQDRGNWRVVMLILLPVASDTGGYIAGVLFGKHPMAPSVSPKKSWEGFIGSVILAAVAGFLGSHFILGFPWLPGEGGALLQSSLVLGLILGVVVAATATLGDLAESLIKRDLGLKDMGDLLPGHGGILDRVDSILITAPFLYLLLVIAA
jgi:phosphatidate cytidylyltransferase